MRQAARRLHQVDSLQFLAMMSADNGWLNVNGANVAANLDVIYSVDITLDEGLYEVRRCPK